MPENIRPRSTKEASSNPRNRKPCVASMCRLNSRHLFHVLIVLFFAVGYSDHAYSEPSETQKFQEISSAIFPNSSTTPEMAIEDIYESEFEKPESEDYLKQAYRHKEPADTNRNWWHLLRKGQLNINDSTVEYPGFLRFCLKVYKWADKTFNSYDTTYVVGTGRNWKIRLLSDNWVDSYQLDPGKKFPIRMMSEPYNNIGAYLQYMAVSVGYSFDMNKLIGKHPANHEKIEYTFNCARFNIEGHVWTNSGGTYIRTFGDFNDGHLIKKYFEGVKLKNIETYGYYFFNNRKFSMSAAYNYSKFQRKSAGSAILGIGYNNLDVDMDLRLLPEELIPYLKITPENYKFHYRSYTIIGGYTYNWVIHPKWLFNATALPGMGITLTYADNYSGTAKTMANNIRATGSLTYNNKDFFLCAVAKFYGSFYWSGSNSLFSSVENLQLSVGWRF